MKPYFKWTQVFFFRIFEFSINDSALQVITKLVIIPLCFAKDEKLYAESEIWTFHAPLADEIIEKLLASMTISMIYVSSFRSVILILQKIHSNWVILA
jgi:hypothetical protein